ncbi:YegP family protein [Nocardia suismassiliense]|uniref:YegP family protein n=1 Tax=Nocardia suismassiliense TaxID=2077092 RepID=A0ABW6QTW5_9NOCA
MVHRFLRARAVIAVGEGYKSKSAREKGIESIKENAPAVSVVDQATAGV